MAEQEYQSNIPQNGQQSSIAGIVDDIVYQSEESGYVVCVIEDASSGEPVTVVGTIPYLSEGDRITVQGDWVNHPKANGYQALLLRQGAACRSGGHPPVSRGRQHQGDRSPNGTENGGAVRQRHVHRH